MPKVYLLGEHPAWNARNHADALIKRAPPGWSVEWSMWSADDRRWRFGDADVIFNLGSNCQENLWTEAKARNSRAVVAVRFNTCYPRLADRFAAFVKQADRVAVESRLCHLRTRDLFPGRVEHLPTGVDLDEYRPLVPPHARPRRALWCAGCFGPNQSSERADVKRFALAVQVAEALKQHGVEMELLTVEPCGNGPIKTRAEMIDWYNTGRVYVVTSAMEGVPNVGLEAAACGCAVVSTPVGRMPELIGCGVNGFLVDDPTVSEFCSAIVRACDHFEAMTDGIHERVIEHGWDVLADRYYNAFTEWMRCSQKS